MCFCRVNYSIIVLGFFNPTLQLRHWHVTSFCMQFENSEDRKRHWGERGPWYKGRRREMENTAVTSVCHSWNVGLKKPRTIYLRLPNPTLFHPWMSKRKKL